MSELQPDDHKAPRTRGRQIAWDVSLPLVAAVVSIAVSWGTTRGDIDESKRRIAQLETDQRERSRDDTKLRESIAERIFTKEDAGRLRTELLEAIRETRSK